MLDQKLSSLDIGFLEMTCVLPQWSPCGVTPTDDTMLPLLVAGALLFLLTLGLVIFDRRVVPCVIGKRLTEEEKCKAVDEGATSLGQPHLVPSSDALRLAAAMPMENIQRTSFGNARGRALVAALFGTIFLPVSTVAVLARVALIIAYQMALPRQLPVARAVLELFLALVPFLWCVCPVRSASAAQVAFCGPGSRCQRFSSFALVTVAAEMYSTIMASMAVASTCGASPWPPLLFYCLGVMVTVLRCYSSVLAVRLQDFAAGTCRRVSPQELQDVVGTSDIQCQVEDPHVEQKGFTSTASLAWEEALASADENLLCACLPDSCCPVTRKRCAGRRFLLQGGLCLAISSAVLSAVAAHAVAASQKAATAAPSSCGVARNSTTSCVPWQLAGTHLFDRRSGDLQMDLANTLEDCCGGCDELEECQAWIFERVAKRCRWIRFEDEVCNKNPEHLGCRCVTHWGTAFGFKAKSNMVWLTAT